MSSRVVQTDVAAGSWVDVFDVIVDGAARDARARTKSSIRGASGPMSANTAVVHHAEVSAIEIRRR